MNALNEEITEETEIQSQEVDGVEAATEQLEGQVQPEELTDESEPEQQAEPKAVEPDAVAKLAQDMGWSPKDNWRGNPDLWKPADQFIRETHNINSHLKTELQQTKRDFETRAEKMERMAKVSLQQQRQRIEQDYEYRKYAAAQEADTDSYRAAMEGQQQALRRFDEQTSDPEPTNEQGAPEPAVQDFIARNREWYGQDPVMTGAAKETWGYYQGNFPGLPMERIAEMVEGDLKKTFPQKFNGGAAKPQQANTNRPAQAQVEGGLRPISGAQKKGWDALPPEAKSQGTEFINDGIYGDDKSKAKKAYAEQYWAQ